MKCWGLASLLSKELGERRAGSASLDRESKLKEGDGGAGAVPGLASLVFCFRLLIDG